MKSRAYIVILNWNGWKDTLSCLESVLNLDYPDYRIVLCDNASSDESVSKIRSWASGSFFSADSISPIQTQFCQPSAKPLRLIEYDRSAAELGGDQCEVEDALVLVHTGENLGFAGGNNVGIRYAMARGDADFVWLLNNDTVVTPTALSALISVAQSRSDIGMVGSTLLYYHRPEIVQALGGGYFLATRAQTHHVEEGTVWRPLDEKSRLEVERRLSYVTGASMLVTKDMLVRVGLMQEDYFLYYEEIDWAERARRVSPPLISGYASESVVFHKEGASAGTNSCSLLSVRLLARNRLRFMKRFYRSYLSLTRWWVFIDGMKSLAKGRFAASLILIRESLQPISVTIWKDVKK